LVKRYRWFIGAGRLLYNKGQQALIYYNPEKPSEGVIKPGLVLGWDQSYGELFQLHTSLILCLGGIGLLIVGILPFRK
jgi:hypothetical protein